MEAVGKISARKAYISDFVALAIICMTIIVYQLCMTKMLSTIAWYHYTFLTLSLVMLGLGAPGIWMATIRNPQRLLAPMLFLGAVTLVGSEMLVMHSIAKLVDPFSRVVLIILAILVPMFCLGSCVCLYLMRAQGRDFGKMYASDLFGAFAGAALAVPAMFIIPTPELIGLLGGLLLVVLVANTRRFIVPSAVMLAVLAALFVMKEPFQLNYTKYVELGKGRIYEKWTPISRITVFDNVFWVEKPEIGFAWGPGKNFPERKITQYWIEQDAGAGTPITEFDGRNLDKLDYLLYDVTSMAYMLRSPKSAAIIGGGGGRDILTALKAGMDDVRVIELNPVMVDTVSRVFGKFSGDIYHHPAVDVQVAEGRSFLARTDKNYDLIQISLIDSWAASMAGAYALAENNLYTKEAYKTYFSRLNPNGLVTTSRWVTGTSFRLPAFEVKRLALMIYEALAELGVQQPEKHIAIITGDMIGNVITSKLPFNEADLAKMHDMAQKGGFTVVHPSSGNSEDDKVYARLLSADRAAAISELFAEGVDITPPTDDRPFFFNVLRPFPLKLSFILDPIKNNAATQVLQNAVVLVLGLTLLLFFVPFIDNYKLRLLPYRSLASSSVYFAMIGCGFMAMEVYMIQRFILYMGNPAYSAAAVLSCLLLGLAAGAFASTRQGGAAFVRFAWVLPVFLLLATLVMQPLFESTLHWGFAAKIAVAFALLFPCAFIGGFFFPAGVACFGDAGKPWFWAINGSFGVFATVMSLPVAMAYGYSCIIWGAIAAYVLAACILLWAARRGAAAS